MLETASTLPLQRAAFANTLHCVKQTPGRSSATTGSRDAGTAGPRTPLPEDAQQIILDSISCGVFTVDSRWRITSFNTAAEQIIGVPREEAIGRPCREVLRGDICQGNCALRETLSDPGVGNIVTLDSR